MSNRFILKNLPLQGLKLIKRNPIADKRGFLQRLYCQETLNELEFSPAISQINLTLTRAVGTVRGMHFQHAPYSEKKIISCLRGEIFDVAVDLRQGSPTFMQWHAEILSPDRCNSFFIPEGFAHGFQTLTPDCELIYFHSAAYQPTAEGGVSPTDPRLNIKWPLAISDLSDRDKNHPLLTTTFEGLT